jgi:hypothetical protein
MKNGIILQRLYREEPGLFFDGNYSFIILYKSSRD